MYAAVSDDLTVVLVCMKGITGGKWLYLKQIEVTA
jgi:hypothetical protein